MANTFLIRLPYCLLLVTSFLATNLCRAQQTHRYTFASGQPTALVADAGEDVVFTSDETVSLGGAPVASGGTEPYTYSWTPSENLSDPTSATPAVTSADDDEIYTLKVTDDAGCQATDNVTVFAGIITSVPSGKEIPFTIYSNTSGGGITIRTATREGTLQLLDSRGTTVLTDRLTPTEHHLHTANFPTGIYVLRLILDRDIYSVKLFVP